MFLNFMAKTSKCFVIARSNEKKFNNKIQFRTNTFLSKRLFHAMMKKGEEEKYVIYDAK